MKFLIFSDLHQFDQNKITKAVPDCDCIIFLGDIMGSSIRYIINEYKNKPFYGIYGNHDDSTLFDTINIINQLLNKPTVQNINLMKEEIGNISFTGLEGSVKYKEGCLGFTQDEAMKLDIPEADILFSHETGYGFMGVKEQAHEGFHAITRYIEKKKPKYNIFGHHHKNCWFQKENTICIGVYGCSVFDFSTGIINNIWS